MVTELANEGEKKMRKAIFFDFDYTLGDSTNGIVLSANYALQKLGLSQKSREEIRKTIGLSLKDTYAALTMKNDREEAELFVKYFKEKADEVMVENTILFDGVKATLQGLKKSGYKIGIITTKLRYRIEQILDKFHAEDVVDLIVGAEDVKVEKPNPEGILWAIDHLQLSKNEVLYVGDSLVDAKAAENAAVNFAGVLSGTTTKREFELHEHVFIGRDIKDVYDFITNSSN